jgi:DNA polymerase
MDSVAEYYEALGALSWQIELGADEAIGDVPVNRYELDAPPARPAAKPAKPEQKPGGIVKPVEVDPVAVATAMAAQARTLDELQAALVAYEHCELKQGARNTVFCDGSPDARVMIIGEAPGRDEDRAGRPFVGRAGQLLDRMLAAIDLERAGPDPARQVYITNILPWRPPQNRNPPTAEMAMMRPFVQRHVELVAPGFLVLTGNVSCQAILRRSGITRMRGTWTEAFGLPVLPMLHPAYLLRTPHAKREAWADLLSLKSRLESR